MARVQPFAAWRYARPESDISPVIAPPYDVISPAQRAELAAKDPDNVVGLELPEGPLDPTVAENRYEVGRATWDAWRANGVLARDPAPALYVLEQRFTLSGREVRRKALIAEVGIEPLDAGVVIPHERTLPKALGDRFELIKATGANFSQVFGLFEDETRVTDKVFSRIMAGDPVATATDEDGVVSTLWASTDPQDAQVLSEFMAERRIFIADGHHRYTTALAFRDLMREEHPEADLDAPFEYVMMALVNMDDPDLAVLPYHRIADGPDGFTSVDFYARLAEHFDITDLPEGHPSDALDGHDRVALLVKTRDDSRPRLAVLRADVDLAQAIALPRSAAWKSLDVAVLQELILWPLLQIHPDHPETLDRITFTKDAHGAFASTAEHDVAFVLRPTLLPQLREVSVTGETMPQKSTYFYPKLPSGLVLRSAR